MTGTSLRLSEMGGRCGHNGGWHTGDINFKDFQFGI